MKTFVKCDAKVWFYRGKIVLLRCVRSSDVRTEV
jgi:hypothetical protein